MNKFSCGYFLHTGCYKKRPWSHSDITVLEFSQCAYILCICVSLYTYCIWCQNSSFSAQSHISTRATTCLWWRHNYKQISKRSPNFSSVSWFPLSISISALNAYCTMIAAMRFHLVKTNVLLPFSNLGTKSGDIHPNSKPICLWRGLSHSYIMTITL